MSRLDQLKPGQKFRLVGGDQVGTVASVAEGWVTVVVDMPMRSVQFNAMTGDADFDATRKRRPTWAGSAEVEAMK